MFILMKGHQPGVYVPLRALFLVFIEILVKSKNCTLINCTILIHLNWIYSVYMRPIKNKRDTNLKWVTFRPRRIHMNVPSHMRKQRKRRNPVKPKKKI